MLGCLRFARWYSADSYRCSTSSESQRQSDTEIMLTLIPCVAWYGHRAGLSDDDRRPSRASFSRSNYCECAPSVPFLFLLLFSVLHPIHSDTASKSPLLFPIPLASSYKCFVSQKISANLQIAPIFGGQNCGLSDRFTGAVFIPDPDVTCLNPIIFTKESEDRLHFHSVKR
jgi:hypothetical protein